MKKIYLFMLSLLMFGTIMAQNNAEKSENPGNSQLAVANVTPLSYGAKDLVFEDNFDTYTAGEKLACQDSITWTTWSGAPCGDEDAFVSDEQSNSGANSVNVVTDNDLVLNLDEYLTSGKHTVSLMVYVPTGGDAYYNILSAFLPAAEWAFEAFFNADGNGTISAGGAEAATFAYSFDTWMESKVVVDLNADWAQYYLDGTLIYEWQWTLGASGDGCVLQLGALDFFGANATTTYYFDDLKIETAEGLAAPTDLTATVFDGNDVDLNWLGAAGTGGWIYWDQQENGDGIGLNGGGTFNCASRWESTDLTPYDGMYLTQISYYHNASPNSTFTLKVWTGADAATLVTSQVVTASISDDWNTLVLDAPVMIDASQELWFGYEVVNADTEYPAGTDLGPAIAYKGDMISTDGATWVSMSTDYDLDYNWNIAGFVAGSAKGQIAQPMVKTVTSDISTADFVSASESGIANAAISKDAKSGPGAAKGFLGYNVYRGGELIAEEIAVTNYKDYDLLPGTYSFDVKAIYDEGFSAGAGPVDATILGGVDRDLVIVEVGTGTWCGYCPGAAMGVDDMHAEGLSVGIIEYHNGDDYATDESNARIDYYSVTGFPTANFDGGNKVVGGSPSESMYSSYLPKYETRIAIPSLFEIEAEYKNTSGENYQISVNAEMIEAYPWLSNGITLQVALTESHIAENWGNQTELNFVCRDMIPNQNGTTLDFAESATQSVQLDFTIPSTYNMENVELIVFIQDNTTKEILQGTTTLFTTGVENIVDNNRINLFPNPATDNINISASIDILSMTVYNVVGQVVFVKNVENDFYKLNTSDLKNGLYFIQMKTEKGIITKRFIIE